MKLCKSIVYFAIISASIVAASLPVRAAIVAYADRNAFLAALSSSSADNHKDLTTGSLSSPLSSGRRALAALGPGLCCRLRLRRSAPQPTVESSGHLRQSWPDLRALSPTQPEITVDPAGWVLIRAESAAGLTPMTNAVHRHHQHPIEQQQIAACPDADLALAKHPFSCGALVLTPAGVSIVVVPLAAHAEARWLTGDASAGPGDHPTQRTPSP